MGDFIIKYWLEALFAGILGIMGFVVKKIKKNQEEQKKKQEEQERKNQAVERGVQALLRNELIRRFREYETKKEISMLDKENMDHMFEEYFNLGGNGLMKEIYNEYLEIPIKVIKE